MNRFDEIERLIRPISKNEYPNVRPYLVLDHFWHWIKAIDKGKSIKKYKLNEKNRDVVIPILFKAFIKWDKSLRSRHTYTSKDILKNEKALRNMLSPKNINKLKKADAIELYSRLHSGQMRIQRFSGDELFAKENPISNIRKSLSYLLWSQDDVAKRISALKSHHNYKLNYFGYSNIQELLGWIHDDLPIRNNKADDAIEMLGFKFR